MKLLRIFRNQYFWLLIILFLGLLARLYKIDSPIADWHSWRQADTAAVTRNFVKSGFNPLIPKYDDMSGAAENPIANPNTFRFVEFPIYNIVTYPFYLFFGVEDKYSRLVSSLFSLGSVIFLFFICKRYLDKWKALFTALIYTLLPFNIFFSRTTLPEPTFLFFALGMMYFVDCWIWENKKAFGFWAFVFTAIAFLIKPWAVFFTLPLIYSIFIRYKFNIPKKFYLLILAFLPFIFWRMWILQQPQGIPAASWLMNSDNIRFRPAFWWWLV
ncbi:MAG: glycosyltransferase family 39 protein [Actinobacteria bacterium]|nr:glycosyltransferase family 39 protein [Actinomycetota bacterium]